MNCFLVFSELSTTLYSFIISKFLDSQYFFALSICASIEHPSESLAAELRKTSRTFSEYKEFYKTFDNIFLGIYPDFVAKTNECFRPEDRFKENGKLTTPLRILALIRLGYTESGEIARFLNCSPETIYSHRSKLKAKAICDRLEDRIKCIGK